MSGRHRFHRRPVIKTTLAATGIAVGVTVLTAGVASADTTNNGNTTETGHHHEFTNCGASAALNVANCVDLLDL